MAKRIVTKVGDVFCVEIDNEYKRYFQYIVSDMTQLNSSVIRAFKKHYPMDYIANPEEIVQDEVDFYAHTVLRAGIVYEAWYKVGKSNNVGDYSHVVFRVDGNLDRVEVSYNWYVWHINKPEKKVGKLPSKYYDAELGSVKPYNEIVSRLKLGHYTYLSPGYK